MVQSEVDVRTPRALCSFPGQGVAWGGQQWAPGHLED